MNDSNGLDPLTACGCWFLVVLFNLAIGGWSVHYLLQFFLDKDISTWADVVIGLFVAELSVPAAVVVWILRSFGVI